MRIFTVLDNYGFIAGFRTEEQAKRLIELHPNVNLIIKIYHTYNESDSDKIWIIQSPSSILPLEIDFDVNHLSKYVTEYEKIDIYVYDKLERTLDIINKDDYYRLTIPTIVDEESPTPLENESAEIESPPEASLEAKEVE